LHAGIVPSPAAIDKLRARILSDVRIFDGGFEVE